jgi:uncharacterized protein (DUF58 family)
VFAGEAAVFRVHLVNSGALARYGVALMRGRLEWGRADIAGGATATLELREPAPRRGWLPMPEFHVTTRYPLGILYSWSRRLALDARCLVYPAPAEPWPWRSHGEIESASAARALASGDDFSGVREYRPGDSPRQIDWKSAARGRGLLTKEFAAGLSESLWFDIARIPAPDIELRLSMICRAVLEAEAAGLQYGLRLGATVIEPQSGEAHQRRCLHALAVYGARDER